MAETTKIASRADTARVKPLTVVVATARPDLPPFLLPKLALGAGIEVHAHCDENQERCFQVLVQRRPELLLLDVDLLGLWGPLALRQIRARFPQGRLMLLYRNFRDLPCDEIILDDVAGCLWLGLPDLLFEKAIRSVMEGELWLSRPLVRRLFNSIRERYRDSQESAEHGGHGLTPRESEIAWLVREGLSNKEIVRKLDISEETVKVHLKHVFEKLGLRRRSQIALCGIGPPLQEA